MGSPVSVSAANLVMEDVEEKATTCTLALINQEATHHHREPTPWKDTEWKSSIVIPYVRGISDAVRCTLAQLKVRVCYRPHHTLKQLLSNLKDTVPDLQKSGVVYQIPCATCSLAKADENRKPRMKEQGRVVATAMAASANADDHALGCILLGLFAFMRSEEFTCRSWEAFTLDMLSPWDVSVNFQMSPLTSGHSLEEEEE